ncbi:MAG: oxidoreductase [Elusimicrobia bacterium RIFCSPLOWO2_01_FULL_64_13]|nr:MAG: oxidoreductase [Elusimicrobia bacterium RIFCSPHIGHO2_01_FULL_64_10]OGR96936.1 MAG: oxidoreductase [Elusimicrobia bacterium RIFCSPLOWO2_01_FULL_64_13]
MPLLTLVTFLPMLGALLILVLPKEKVNWQRTAAVVFSGLSFLVSLQILRVFDPATSALQLAEKSSWIPSFGINYHLGVDGLSLPLLVLTTLLSLLSIIASFNIELRVKEYFFWFLVLETGMLGVFVALDFFLFYIFWEVMLVPMYFLIGIWGGPQKEYAAIKFFLYTLFGSIFMLIAILALYFRADPHTFDIPQLISQGAQFGGRFQTVVFLLLFVAFAIKVPIFPFHTWLPLAHVEAPTAVSVILAGVLLKLGTYGMMRVSFPMFPSAALWFAIPLLILAFINIVYGALVAMAQTDMKKMVAYSSINHMGYALLGMAAFTVTGFNGAILQMVNHGIITGSLFLLVGVIYDRAHTRDLGAFGGLGAKLPVYTGIMVLASMASLGLPGLAGFISEFLCFLGAFSANPEAVVFGNTPAFKLFTALSVIGILVTAAFFLRMIEKVFLGPFNAKWESLKDMSPRELAAVVPLTALTIWIGVWPQWLLSLMNSTVEQMVAFIRQ